MLSKASMTMFWQQNTADDLLGDQALQVRTAQLRCAFARSIGTEDTAVFAIGLRGGIFVTSMPAWGHGAEGRQQVVEQRDWGVRVDGGASTEGFFPPGLKSGRQILAHLLRGVGVQAAHPGNLMAQPLLGKDLGNAILGHPCLPARPAVRNHPQRLVSWASPCTTATTWMPLPPESASQNGSGTWQVWVISSRPVNPLAVRINARAWTYVIWRCWHDGTAYDPAKHNALRAVLARQTQAANEQLP